jgi:hypothetical protein
MMISMLDSTTAHRAGDVVVHQLLEVSAFIIIAAARAVEHMLPGLLPHAARPHRTVVEGTACACKGVKQHLELLLAICGCDIGAWLHRDSSFALEPCRSIVVC